MSPRTSIPAATIVMLICTAKLAVAQQTPGTSLGNTTLLEQQGRQLENQPYTVKSGDFKLLVVPSLSLAWNDNINASHDQALDDFIVGPAVRFDGSYPFTARNLIRFDIGIGYDEYVKHSSYSGVRLLSGSAVSFDIYIKDFWINLHDQFQYFRDTAGQPDVANTGFYGGLNNTAGLSGTWDLEDVVLTLGYDHMNFVSSASEFDYANLATETVTSRAGLRFSPRLTVGAEGSVAFTSYNERVLNNNIAYNAGLYADWKPGEHLEVKPRAGYTFYDFSQTSLVIPAENQSTWYAELDLTHAPTDAISYTLSGGHELRLGIQSQVVTAWYVRPHVDWAFVKHWSLDAYVGYENGKQGSSSFLGIADEHYNWTEFGLGVSHHLTSRLALALNGRFIVRTSTFTPRAYNQNVISLVLTYGL